MYISMYIYTNIYIYIYIYIYPASTSKFRPTSACVGLGALLRPNVGPKYRKKIMKLV